MRSFQKARADAPSPGFLRLIQGVVVLAMSLALTCRAQETVVGDIVFEVEPRQLAPAIEQAFGLHAGDRLTGVSVKEGLDRVVSALGKQGYILASVRELPRSAPDSGFAVHLRFIVRPGPLCMVGSVIILGAAALDSLAAVGIVGLESGEPFISQELERGILRLLDEYHQAGFPFASVSIEDFALGTGSERIASNITLRVQEGLRPPVSALLVEGREITSADVVQKAAGIRPGELYKPQTPVDVKRRLVNLGLFESVSDASVSMMPDGTLGLRYVVRERSPVSFDGLIGYAPAQGTGRSGVITGLADVQLHNLFGTARKLGVRWQRLDRTTQDVSLGYVEPWVASLPLRGTLRLAQRKQDSSYVRWEFGLDAELEFSDLLGISASYARSSVVPTESGKERLAANSMSLGGVAVRLDTRDDRLTPRSGVLYRTSYETGYVTADPPGIEEGSRRSRSTRITIDLEYFIGITRNHVVSLAAHGREFRSATLGAGDLFRLGGATTLRGYREDQFIGSRVAWASAEYRLLTSPRSFVYAFVDGGYVHTPQGSGFQLSEVTRVGYGIGVRQETPVGLIGLSLALGEGDTYRTAKFHLRLINDF